MESNIFSKMFKGDKVIWFIFIALCIISLLEVFSATSTIVYRQQSHWGPILRHFIFLLIGLGGVMTLQFIPPKYFSLLILGVPFSVVLLVITMFLGEDVNGAQRWLGIGAFTIQPSEIAKISLIGFVAFFLSRMKPENTNLIFKIVIIAISATCGCILTENLSTALLLGIVCFMMLIIGQVPWKKIGLIVLVCVSALIILLLSLSFLPDSILPGRFSTWKARIERHGEDSNVVIGENGTTKYEITDQNYQITHAKIAIANGGIVGLPGSGVERDFLPQAYSDFIFAIILEEMGLIGGLFVLFLYLVLLIRAGILASKCDKKFPRYLILGSALMLGLQGFINMAVAVDLIPVTGQPLPLVSRGGTSTIITCIYFGIILSCSSSINNIEAHEDVDESIANINIDDIPTDEPVEN